MCVLDVEATGLQGFETRLNLPAGFIGLDGFLGSVERKEYLQFGLAVAVLHSCSREVAVLAVDEIDAVKALGLADSEVLESPKCLEVAAVARLVDPEVLPDAHVVADAVVVEPANPKASDELAVGHEAVDGGLPEEGDITFHQVDPLSGVGVPFLGKEPKQQREGDTLVGDGQHEGVDVEASELPVGAVH